MPLVFGRTSTGLMVPVLVDANGNVGVGPIAAGSALIGDVQARGLGWYSGAWQKVPVPWGPSGFVRAVVNNTNLSAGANTLNFSAVPAGRTWVITTITAQYTGTVAGVTMDIYVNSGGLYVLGQFTVFTSGAVKAANVFYHFGPGDNMRIDVNGATAGDDAFVWITGYYADLNQ